MTKKTYWIAAIIFLLVNVTSIIIKTIIFSKIEIIKSNVFTSIISAIHY